MKRKLIDIPDEDFRSLSIKAAKAGKFLKPYIEDLLAKDARNELHAKDHFLNTARKCEVPLVDAEWVVKNLNKQETENSDSPLGAVSERFLYTITEMENEIVSNLSDLDRGYGRRKFAISKQTGIPEDILTVLLKRLKLAGKVELIMIFSESSGLPDGSGYCLRHVTG